MDMGPNGKPYRTPGEEDEALRGTFERLPPEIEAQGQRSHMIITLKDIQTVVLKIQSGEWDWALPAITYAIEGREDQIAILKAQRNATRGELER